MTHTATFPVRLERDTTSPSDDLEWHGPINEAAANSRTPPTVELHQLAMRLPKADSDERPAIRAEILRAIRNASVGEESALDYIEAAIEGLLASKQPGRLDDAVEILSLTGEQLKRFAGYAMTDKSTDKTDPDYWYVLVLALGEMTRGEESPHFLVDWALNTGERQLMEAAMLVLGDRDDDVSREKLRKIARNHDSAFIRELAEEILEDMAP